MLWRYERMVTYIRMKFSLHVYVHDCLSLACLHACLSSCQEFARTADVLGCFWLIYSMISAAGTRLTIWSRPLNSWVFKTLSEQLSKFQKDMFVQIVYKTFHGAKMNYWTMLFSDTQVRRSLKIHSLCYMMCSSIYIHISSNFRFPWV